MTTKKQANERVRKSPNDGEELRTIAVCTRLDTKEAAKLDELRGKIQRGAYLRMLVNGTAPHKIPTINVQAYNVLSDIQHHLAELDFSASRSEFDAGELAEIRNLLLMLRLELLDVKLE